VSTDGRHESTYRASYATLVVRHDDDLIRIAARGEIDLTASAALDQVIEDVARRLDGPSQPVVLDMSAVAFLDAAGIPFVQSLVDLTEKARTQFGIQDPPAHVRRLLTIVGMNDYITGA